MNNSIKTLVFFVVFMAQTMAAFAQSGKIASEDFYIPSAAPGIQLFMRYKHLAGVKATSPDNIFLYVHGATYPSETAFDLPI